MNICSAWRCQFKKRMVRARRGNMTLLLCFIFPVLLAISAYSINVVYMELARTELQLTTDVATRAAGRVLAVTGDQKQAIEAADKMLKLNPFANTTIGVSDTKVTFGVSTRLNESERYLFASGPNPNAVKIEGNGKVQVPMLFPTMGIPIEFRPIKTAICTKSELDISLVLDRSGSMAFSTTEAAGAYPPAAAPIGWSFGQPVPPQSRWLDAVDAIRVFLALAEGTVQTERISLATYSDGSSLDVKLTTDYSMISDSMDAYSQNFSGGATNISDGTFEGTLALGDKKAARPWATRVMIILTDGVWTAGVDPVIAAQQAAGEHILIYTITFSNEADIKKMQEVAAIGSGEHYHASSASDLRAAFEQIARRLPTLLTF